MIKPILKIELPEGTSQEDFEKAEANLQRTTAIAEYHVILLVGKTDYINIEIITAPDASIHKP